MTRLAISIAASLATSSASLGTFGPGDDVRAQGTKEVANAKDPLLDVRNGKEVLRPESSKREASRGPAVEELQKLLNSLGADPPIKITGIYDAETFNAVKTFQRAVGEKDDGLTGKKTLEAAEKRAPGLGAKILDTLGLSPTFKVGDPHQDALNSLNRGRTISPTNATKEEVMALQELLNQAGAHPPLAINGEFNQRTQDVLLNLKRGWIEADKQQKLTKDKATTVILEPKVTATTVERIRAAISASGGTPGKSLETMQRIVGLSTTLLAPSGKDTINDALAFTIKAEGGLNADKQDKGNRGGNVTMKGVTQPVFDKYIDDLNKERQPGEPKREHQSLRDGISDQDLRGVYERYYFNLGKCDKMPAVLAIVHFDACVNMGVSRAAYILQDVLGAEIDGKIGPRTLALISSTDLAWTVNAYLKKREEFCIKLAQREDYSKYRDGWVNRVSALKSHVYLGMPPAARLDGSEPPQYHLDEFKTAIQGMTPEQYKNLMKK